ncbi:MAG: ATP-binding protein, partial [Bacteroidota bacterium]
EQDQITKFDVANGLSNSNTTCIYPDALGNLWIPTFYGLNYLNTKQFTIQSFFEDSGLTHNEFNNASHLLTSDSLLYLGGLNGVTIVDLRQGAYDFTSKNKIPLVANRLELYNKKTEKIADIEISDYSVIKIPSNAKGLILDFDFLDFTEEESHDFLYKIENLEDTWIAKKNHQLELVVPPAGEYIIRMKVKSKDGRWSSNEIAIPILVKKPIYFKAWFILLLALSLGGISYGFIQFLLYQNRKENKRLEKEVQRRTQEIEEDKRIIAQQLQKIQEVQESKEKVFSIIGHDLRSPLLGLKNLTQKIDYLIKHNRWSDLSILTQRFDKNIDTLQALLDKLLVWTQLEQGEYQISPDWVCLVEIIEETITLYEPLIQKKEIQLSVEILPKSELFVDYRSLATILRNLIDNAIKHTPEKGIIKIYADHSLISIKNQGEKMSGRLISFLEASNGKVKYPDTGLGLQICRELVLLNKGEIKVKNEQAYSNTIYVKFTYQ